MEDAVDTAARKPGAGVALKYIAAILVAFAAIAGAVAIYYGTVQAQADSDNDGLTNQQEAELGTNPNDPDSDNDGLSDGDEVNEYETSPLEYDTDGDGLGDGDEILKYGTDPKDLDTDDDGIQDGLEVMSYGTDPTKADTDGDGLLDPDEIDRYGTDPTLVDTDLDGLTDYEEVELGTNPLSIDTDGDRVPDGSDINPLGDAVLVIYIAYWEEKTAVDFLSAGDPVFYVEVYDYKDKLIDWAELGPFSNVSVVRGYEITVNIPDDERSFRIVIAVYDSDPGGYSIYDINPELGEYAVVIDYSVEMGLREYRFDGSADGSAHDNDGLLVVQVYVR